MLTLFGSHDRSDIALTRVARKPVTRMQPFGLSPNPRFMYRSDAYIWAFEQITAAVRQRERLLHTMIDLLPVGVWATDKRGRVTLVNPAADKIWSGHDWAGDLDPGELPRRPGRVPDCFATIGGARPKACVACALPRVCYRYRA